MSAPHPPTLTQALAEAQAAGVDRLDAQRLLAWLLERPRSWLISHDDDRLPAATHQRYQGLWQRLQAGEPLAYLLGEHEFHGLRLAIAPGVLVPRADTETLVDWALELLDGPLASRPAPAVVDLGTGSGAIALAVKHRRPAVQMTALDLSPEALAQAQANSVQLGVALRLLHSRWWSALPDERFDLVVSNPPYIAGDDPHLAGLRHEPLLALTPGGDGLDALRQLAADSPAHLHPGGWLLLEHGWDQAEAVQGLLREAGFVAVSSRRDLAGHLRCTGGCWPVA